MNKKIEEREKVISAKKIITEEQRALLKSQTDRQQKESTSVSVRFPKDVFDFFKHTNKTEFILESITRFLALKQNPVAVLENVRKSFPRQFAFVQEYNSAKAKRKRIMQMKNYSLAENDKTEKEFSVKTSFEIPIKLLQEIKHFSLSDNNSKFIIDAVRLNIKKQKELVAYLMDLRFLCPDEWQYINRKISSEEARAEK